MYNAHHMEESSLTTPLLQSDGGDWLTSEVREAIGKNTPLIRKACIDRMDMLRAAQELIMINQVPSMLQAYGLHDGHYKYRDTIKKYEDESSSNEIFPTIVKLQKTIDEYQRNGNQNAELVGHLIDLQKALRWTSSASFPHKLMKQSKDPLTLTDQESKNSMAYVNEEYATAESLLRKYPEVDYTSSTSSTASANSSNRRSSGSRRH